MSVAPLPFTVQRVTVALTAALVLALAPGRASAGCGDYVTVVGGHAFGHAAAEPGTDLPSPRKPCDGPGCSEGPSVPLSPISVPKIQLSDVKACPAALGEPTRAGSGEPDSLPSNLRPIDRSDPIEHPPRA